jgi:hypothetical protein|tara:strand:+ start:537 stop:1442 length:906 start_codon:yes stop_codon:yes gene_type:complete
MKNKLQQFIALPAAILKKLTNIELALGRIESRQNSCIDSQNINDYEFKVSSQWGEDGIIQHLVKSIEIKNKVFFEFGVEKYTESNTRFLLQNNHWKGLVIDGSDENISYIKNDPIYWKNNLKAECAFITKDNINQLITKNGINGDIGILSVDIDGNDYWIWKAIDCISPRIVICEYNSHFGDTYKVSIPYDNNFVREKKHHSNIYYGASISALDFLAKKKGYSLVGSNLAGNNVFFVRNDLMTDTKALTPKEAYRVAQFREARDESGSLTFNDIKFNLKLISNLELINVETEELIKIEQIF